MRLTRKFKTDYYFNTDHKDIVEKDIDNDFHAAQAMRNKLGQLEDIEDELGIDLATLFKALKNGIWYRLQNGKLRYMQVTLALIPQGWVLAEFYPKATNVAIQLYNRMHGYGVEWALTKEELE